MIDNYQSRDYSNEGVEDNNDDRYFYYRSENGETGGIYEELKQEIK